MALADHFIVTKLNLMSFSLFLKMRYLASIHLPQSFAFRGHMRASLDVTYKFISLQL